MLRIPFSSLRLFYNSTCVYCCVFVVAPTWHGKHPAFPTFRISKQKKKPRRVKEEAEKDAENRNVNVRRRFLKRSKVVFPVGGHGGGGGSGAAARGMRAAYVPQSSRRDNSMPLDG